MQAAETTERYLEEIYFLQQNSVEVHAIDVCKAMGYSKPTISVKMKQLVGEGYITIDKNEHIRLTDKGYALAGKISERHHFLTRLFLMLGVDAETAETDACKIEHDLSDTTFDKLKAFFNGEIGS